MTHVRDLLSEITLKSMKYHANTKDRFTISKGTESGGSFLIASDIAATATLDLYFDPFHGIIAESKTTCDGHHLFAEIPVADAMDDIPYEQVMAIAEAVLCHCSREDSESQLTDENKRGFNKLVAEVHYDIHEMNEIREAVIEYYY